MCCPFGRRFRVRSTTTLGLHPRSGRRVFQKTVPGKHYIRNMVARGQAVRKPHPTEAGGFLDIKSFFVEIARGTEHGTMGCYCV